ncbi:4-hydroxy-tetrahydrodipicolinate reductase [Aurantiacibacter gangjinensis]|uniref:4-hydroxy-tetrahydrodipicolinate reductase n=1 Tax=Aurantiacibacter gangjinensis TaxID=502682 RepID=A0A0G9MKE2_9SPHN|nr:4-hydroxy-tetrahydrodipicolinate reductase [Aurantiacibacter gangjinensis]APE29478.1 4-hydroxy-tetrahydrodipicolinate reductase [Aurantiacibacter gangjinensis]KLE31145.1 4-hydroxy-tetrahydrodipicolinate reductase [Aurantiacibacter gangjinensis]
MAKIGIIGSAGRMGQAIADVLEGSEHSFAGGADHGDAVGALAAKSDALVDFSAPGALAGNLQAAREAGIPILIGTTGLEDEHHRAIDEAAEAIPVLHTGNTSLGVNVLCHLIHRAAETLGEDWDIEIVEMHHRHKVDAPSGTALLMGMAAAEGRGIALDDNSERGRDGMTGERAQGAIGFASLRGGTVAGDHSAIFAGEQERITLSHSAENRSIFARGAVRGAAWLIGREAGRYTMNDVLGLG